MTRGTLRVLLGAAPGVGKTYAMLQEGHQLAAEGRDVVLALVETHDREPTAALVDGLEMVPRRTFEHRGVQLSDMDLDAVLARAPEIALVDELAHTNVGTSGNQKRWQDVDALLEAGIDVISTVNVQHIESLGDVVRDITGATQRESIPDTVLRAAEAIELIDLTPQGLRARLAEGLIYPPGRIDAALSNYFRLGNLTALREIALHWLADEVDSALERYRAEHGISARWETRERVMVALTGGPEGETLLRRGARIAARSSGRELSAVHVSTPDGLLGAHPKVLADQRLLVERLGGSYHQVIGEDVPAALVEFARANNATQLVIGASRRSKLATVLTGPGIGAGIVRLSGDIDVHMVNHAAAASGHRLPRSRGALTRGRTLAGFVLALLGGPLLTWFLGRLPNTDDSITVDVLAYQLLVVIVALVGGLFPAVFAALLSGLTLDFFFIAPLYTITIAEPTHLVVLILYILIAILVSVVVDQAARRHRAATRSAAESALLATVSGSVLRGADALEALLNQSCEAFSLRGVRLLEAGGEAHSAGNPGDGEPETVLPVGTRATLELYGREMPAADRRALAAIVSQLEAVLDFRTVSATASELAPLAEADRVRSALLQAVGHDLRRPLTAAITAVSSLRSTDVVYGEHDRAELLETADESLQGLSVLVTDLLDVSRLQAGILGVNMTRISVEDVLLPALEETGLGPADIEVDVPQDLEQLTADPVLMKRIVVNLLLNALRHGIGPRCPILAASQFAGRTEVRVIAFGPGIPAAEKEAVFVPFQRHGDTDNLTGLGLGLALSRGFAGFRRGHGRVADRGGHPGRRIDHGSFDSNCTGTNTGGADPVHQASRGARRMKILIADDDPQILRALRITLGAYGYQVIPAADGAAAVRLAVATHPDLVLLDLGMPKLDGLEVIAALRGWSSIPILIISGRSDASDKVSALDAGADDYVTKPFSTEELLARIRALSRRAPGVSDSAESPVISFADVSVDLVAKVVTRGVPAKPVRLTPTEWRVLEVLLGHPGKLVTQQTLLNEVWGPQLLKETGYLRLYLGQLRKKLEPVPSAPRYLVTEPGMGYRFVPE